ncbi:MAG: ABC transporter permease [Actinomycetota bacterium]
MQRAQEAAEIRVIEHHTPIGGRLRDLVHYRELLTNLIRKELRVKYKNSVLGFVWSMLNPALYLVIFWIVFTKFLGGNIPEFPIYLLSGLLAFNLWSSSLGGTVASLIGNSNLVTKVYFPREILPLASIGASLMHFFFQFVVLLLALIVFRHPVGIEALYLIPLALIVEIVLLVGVGLIVSVLNVYFRDVQHLLELILLAWFWMTPIVYPIHFVETKGAGIFKLYLLNPMTSIVLAFQRGIYGEQFDTVTGAPLLIENATPLYYARNVGIVGAGALILVAVGWTIFRRLESRLAEEL